MNVTTIMNDEQYCNLATEILADNNYYSILSRDPSNTIQQKSNKLITDLEKKKMITKEIAMTSRVYNGSINKFYDDIILTIPQGSTQTLLQVFNSYHPRLQFTIEEEDDNHSVPFLDTKVIRKDDNKLITSWYTKPGASGRFLHYESYHEQRQKVNLVLGMKNRVLKTSHTTLKNDNLHKLAKKIHRQWVPKEVDKDDILDTSGVVYCIPCTNCEQKYIGQTKRKLKDRITSHKSDIRLDKRTCTLAQHVLTNNHTPDYGSVSILEQENNLTKRTFLEMSHIFKEEHTINTRKDIEGLNMGFYQDIKDRFGYSTMMRLKTVTNTNCKLATLRNRQTFLIKCRKYNIFPKHITDGVKNVANLTNAAQGRTLHTTLHFNSRKQSIKYNLHFYQIKNNNIRKFNNLKQSVQFTIKTPPQWIKNLSNTEIPQQHWDRNLALNQKKSDIKIPRFLADIDYITHNIPESERNLILTQTTNIVTNFVHSGNCGDNQIQNQFLECKKFLKK
ncbi:hypothetical protein NQ317_007632 [Molorchus minor]|uniref:GIY-YIG domain-containing protein n=1 Tax=Molorchus minor TaxID=1323400 RepID=A0ABQ9J8J2_9CUCU|nr:hypothetical protein NQ317_007632 [Molorchus minor]